MLLQATQLEKVANGVQMGGYEATRFKNQTPKPTLRSLIVLQRGSGSDSAADEAAITRGLSLAKGNLLARCAFLLYRKTLNAAFRLSCPVTGSVLPLHDAEASAAEKFLRSLTARAVHECPWWERPQSC